jgi:hypothetical protein
MSPRRRYQLFRTWWSLRNAAIGAEPERRARLLRIAERIKARILFDGASHT